MSSFHSIDSSTSDSSDSSLHASDLNDSPNSSVSSIHDIDPMQHAMLSTMRQMVDDSKRSTLAIVNAFSNSFANQSVSQLQMTQLLAASHLSQSITGDNKLMILSSLKPFDIQLFINEGTIDYHNGSPRYLLHQIKSNVMLSILEDLNLSF